MITLNYSQFRTNMKDNLDLVSDLNETLIITGKKNRNVVILSQETYDSLMENLYVMSTKGNYDWLMESRRQLVADRCHYRSN